MRRNAGVIFDPGLLPLYKSRVGGHHQLHPYKPRTCLCIYLALTYIIPINQIPFATYFIRLRTYFSLALHSFRLEEDFAHTYYLYLSQSHFVPIPFFPHLTLSPCIRGSLSSFSIFFFCIEVVVVDRRSLET